MSDTDPATGPGSIWLAIVALVWAGMVIGVSGLATPIKFQAPSLSLPVALEVGRVTFRAFSRVEWLLTVLLLLAALMGGLRLRAWLWLPVCLVVTIVLAQSLWLLPVLDMRIAAVIRAEPLPPSQDHLFYIIAEGVKLAALFAIGATALRHRRLKG